MKGLLISLIVLSSAAQAGELLHLRSGVVDPTVKRQLLQNVPAVMTIAETSSKENFIVQFKGLITEADRVMLKNRGLTILSYFPDDAYLVKGHNIEGLESHSSVRAVVPMMSTWKVSPDFAPRSVFSAQQAELTIIKLRQESDMAGFVEQLSQRFPQARVLAQSGRNLQVLIAQGDLDRVAGLEQVLWLQPDPQFNLLTMDLGEIVLDDEAASEGESEIKGDYTDLTGYEDGTLVMKFPAAWSRGFTGRGQKVSMADTGLDSGNTQTIYQDFASVRKGYYFGLYSSSWSDPMGHGTHVAGSVMGAGRGSGGKLRGGAYEAEMIPEGMWSSVLNNLTVPNELKTLFQPAYDDGARVHTNSWGGARRFGAYDDFAVMADDFIWTHPEMLVLFAAGNSGVDRNKDGRIDPNSMASPGTAKNVLTVGASENYVLKGGIQKKLGELLDGQPWGIEPLASDTLSNNPNGLAAFSSRGPTVDGRIKPDVVAPGTNVVSNCSHVQGSSPLWGNYNTDYCYSGGTSMSTPLVAGAAVVVRHYLAAEWSNSTPSAALVKGILMHTTDDLFPGQYGAIGKERGQEILEKGPNSDQGYGRVNVERATTGQSANYYLALADEKQGIAQGEAKAVVVRGDLSRSVKVTLVYTDAPGIANASKALVNDLDLVVTLQDGSQVKSQSRVNNHEQVVIENLSSPVRSIEVVGYSVPQGMSGKQPFAVIVTR